MGFGPHFGPHFGVSSTDSNQGGGGKTIKEARDVIKKLYTKIPKSKILQGNYT